MTDDEREALVERMAQKIYLAQTPKVSWARATALTQSLHRRVARHLLAEAEPVVRAAERKTAAKMLDTRIAEIRADQAYWGGPDMTNGKVLIPELERLAKALRARSAAAGEATP